MNNTTKIIFIRHGESLGNANKTFLGHTDLDLSELGYKQAEATAKHLKNEKIDVISRHAKSHSLPCLIFLPVVTLAKLYA